MKVPEQYRVKNGVLKSDQDYGNNGCFVIPSCLHGRELAVIASDGLGWDHVSVSCRRKSKICIPVWDEMCQIKDLFWGDEDCVIQYHPPKSEYVNNCENCLHLWKPQKSVIPTPPSILVGIK